MGIALRFWQTSELTLKFFLEFCHFTLSISVVHVGLKILSFNNPVLKVCAGTNGWWFTDQDVC